MCLAIPGKLIAVEASGDLRMGSVDFGGVRKRVCLEHVPEAQPGDYVLVHVGFALSRLDEEEALRVFALLEELGQLDELGEPNELGERGVVKLVDEFRDPDAARKLSDAIARTVTRPWVIMEVCGGQTHALVKYGVDRMLPPELELVHGPGCPVCVTPLEMIDRAHAIASMPNVTFCSFGDMLRVPGSHGDLLALKSRGHDVRIVYSPLDAVELATREPSRQVVFFAIGFETTAPANAMAIVLAEKRNLANFSVLIAHVLVPPAMSAILESNDNRVQAFLGPGHVCAVMGLAAYHPIAARYRVPIVVSGFEPIDLLEGTLRAVRQLEEGRASVENAYARAVRDEGNPAALRLLDRVFETCDRKWRGLGTFPKSGYGLRSEYQAFDAERRFEVAGVLADEPAACISGLILKGQKKPRDCPAFGTSCTPEQPLGATMVSTEGACAAYFAYRPGLLSEGRLTRGAEVTR